MSKYLGFLAATLAATLLAGAVSAGSIQENRSESMKMQWANFKPFVAVSKGKAEPSMDLVGKAEALVQLSKGILVNFPEGSGGGKSRAKAAIWDNWPQFEKKAAAFQAATPGLVAAAKSGDAAKIKGAVGAVGKACGSCHKAFRAPKKKK